MKILTLVARILLGLEFVIFGLNGFLQFMKAPLPPGPAGAFLGAMMETHYLYPIAFLQVLCGALFLINRYIPLALTLICPVLVNILMFHAFMAPAGAGPGIVSTVCWLIIYWSVRPAFKGILQQKTTV